MRVVVAPDKFAGTLSAAEAARAIAEGWASSRPTDEIVIVPMADGGEGTLTVVAEAVEGSRRHTIQAQDARGRRVGAVWLRLPDGRAMVEAAAACGLSRLGRDERDPLTATSYGVGQLLTDATGQVTEVVIGLGGSATVDGGVGMASALGHAFLDEEGVPLPPGGEPLRRLAHIEPGKPLSARVTVAVDVTSPLLGPTGAASVFGPQKGASPEDVEVLEEGLRNLADVSERSLRGGPWRDIPGAGAAGGLGFGLAAFCGADFANGARAVAELIGLEDKLHGADVVITGEGKLDEQTRQGKTPAYVAQRAQAAGARFFAVAGQVTDRAEELFEEVGVLGPEGLDRPRELVRERAAGLAERL